MDRWIFPTILLCIPLCLGLLQNQGNQVFEPTNLRIYSNDSLQQLLLEWDVSDDSEAYNSQIDMIFNIQVRLREENEKIILNVNYTTVLNKSRQLHQWGFISEVPLQCATHEARIRSKVMSSEIWSNWSYWVAAEGPDALSDATIHFFPKHKVFERGSKITFCCIARKNQSVSVFIIHNNLKFPEGDRQRALLTLTPESSFPSRIRFGCFFSDSGNLLIATYLYLTRQPVKPQNLSCETEDMINIKCTWDPGYVEKTEYLEKVCPMEFILSDVSSGKIYCSTKFKNTCSFKMGNQFLYNVNLTSRNCLGQKHEQFRFDVNNSGGLSTNS
ncbi:oncostatin-M-specific receptor subunit beta-like [Pantherophis guttatus]|uniref:Oncostatin-M-specific receptor subunit beta-like n=1 Tax=Pantherophis guttatus TaxID=94885 RepID=A0ABM3ZCX5_PANGU|nr:oncostatin-M-specific receptor subunit beta-like [Pantherophis guttatus]XP_060546212.1 oncostatin-M-specific receptor subunit beta-like [Pantherophis guttatus]